jgi:hypothetical protein
MAKKENHWPRLAKREDENFSLKSKKTGIPSAVPRESSSKDNVRKEMNSTSMLKSSGNSVPQRMAWATRFRSKSSCRQMMGMAPWNP